MIAYLSIASHVHWRRRNEIISEIMTKNPEITEVTFWVKGTPYTDKKLKEADIVYSYIPCPQIDDELVAYVGRGQYNEYEINEKPFVVITNDYSRFQVIDDEIYMINDWKKNYAKLKLKPISLGNIINKRLLLLSV